MKLYRMGEAEQETGWTRQWLHELIKREEIRVVRRYGITLIPRSEIERLKKLRMSNSMLP